MNNQSLIKITILGLLAGLFSVAAAQAQCASCSQPSADEKMAINGNKLVAPYLEIQTALAGDDLESARDAARKWHEWLKASNTPAVNGSGLLQISGSLAGAESMPRFRQAFSYASTHLVAFLQNHPVQMDEPLFLAHCPMAFQNQGASWVQNSDTVANPYFGAKMLRCGSLNPMGQKTAAKPDQSGHGMHH